MTGIVAAIIQSRASSKRFPRKAFELLHGRPLLSWVISRALMIQGVHVVVVAVPSVEIEEYAPLIREWRPEPRVKWVGGPLEDVLRRYELAAMTVGAEHIIRITGDCPLLCPLEAENVLHHYARLDQEGKSTDAFVTNDTRISGVPDGCDVEVFHATWLHTALHMDYPLSNYDREHVTPFIQRQAKKFIVYRTEKCEPLKLSVDTKEDFVRVKAIMSALPHVLDPGVFGCSLETTLKAVAYARSTGAAI